MSSDKYLVISGIPGVTGGFKTLSWKREVTNMFNFGIVHLIVWLTAARVRVTEIYGRNDVCSLLPRSVFAEINGSSRSQNSSIVVLVADEDFESALQTFVGKHEVTINSTSHVAFVQRCLAKTPNELQSLGIFINICVTLLIVLTPSPRLRKIEPEQCMEPMDKPQAEEEDRV